MTSMETRRCDVVVVASVIVDKFKRKTISPVLITVLLLLLLAAVVVVLS